MHYVKKVCRPAMNKYGIDPPHPDLACVPWDSPEAESYWGAMAACANYAWANRQAMAEKARQVLREVFGGAFTIWTIYDVAHNIAKIEEFNGKELVVHRKGATRALPAGWRAPANTASGQPALIPGSMGTRSWVITAPEIHRTLNRLIMGQAG